MKRLSLFLLLAGLIFFASNGFVTVSDCPFTIDGCILNIDDLFLQLKPGNVTLSESVSIHVYITKKNKVQAVGFSRLEILKMPDSGMSLRIPLSLGLKKNHDYQVRVVVHTESEKVVENLFASLPAIGSSSNSFFKREFNPIPELADLRNSIEKIAPRAQMRIN